MREKNFCYDEDGKISGKKGGGGVWKGGLDRGRRGEKMDGGEFWGWFGHWEPWRLGLILQCFFGDFKFWT